MQYAILPYGQNVAIQQQDFVLRLVLNLKSQNVFLQDDGHFQSVNINNLHTSFQTESSYLNAITRCTLNLKQIRYMVFEVMNKSTGNMILKYK